MQQSRSIMHYKLLFLQTWQDTSCVKDKGRFRRAKSEPTKATASKKNTPHYRTISKVAFVQESKRQGEEGF